jgi:hypothetical protein
MRARRGFKKSAKMRYLEREIHDDADLARSFDSDTIPQSAHDGCARDDRWPWKDNGIPTMRLER